MNKKNFFIYSYSRAIFDIAIKEDINIWFNLIKKIEIIINYINVFKFLKDFSISYKKKINIFLNFFDEDIINNKKIINFIKILIKNKRIIFFSQIAKNFYFLKDSYYNIKNIKIISAYKLSNLQLLKLIDKIKKKFFCEIKYKIYINKTIIGGILIIINDYIYDVSIKNNLKILFKNLIN